MMISSINYRNKKCALNAPFQFINSVPKRRNRNILLVCPLAKAQGVTIKLNKPIVSFISSLFCICRPPNVSRNITFRVIYAINAVLFTWAFAQVINSIFEKNRKIICPIMVHSNPPSAPIMKPYKAFIKASIFYLNPFWIKIIFSKSMRFMSFALNLFKEASARVFYPFSQGMPISCSVITTNAFTEPHSLTSIVSPIETKNFKPSKGLVSDIFKIMLFWVRLKTNFRDIFDNSHAVYSEIVNELVRVCLGFQQPFRLAYYTPNLLKGGV